MCAQMPSKVAGTRDMPERYKARIKFNYEEHFLGYFPSWEEADEAERLERLDLTGVEYPTRKRR